MLMKRLMLPTGTRWFVGVSISKYHVTTVFLAKELATKESIRCSETAVPA